LMLSVEIVSKPGRLRAVADTLRRVAPNQAATQPPTPAVTPVPVQTQTPAHAPVNGQVPAMTEQPGGPQTGQTTAVRGDGQAEEAVRVRRGRPEDSEPLDEQLVTLALGVGRQWRERTGREVTRDG